MVRNLVVNKYYNCPLNMLGIHCSIELYRSHNHTRTPTHPYLAAEIRSALLVWLAPHTYKQRLEYRIFKVGEAFDYFSRVMY